MSFGGTYPALALALFALLAGCAGGSTKPADVPEPMAPMASVSSDVGAITGTVTNEELLPLPNVEISVRETQVRARSDDAGRFTINDVAPGSYALIAAALGYESKAVKVAVAAGEVVTTNFTLVSIAIAEPRIEVLQHTILITACAFDVVGLCDNPATCPDCNWRLEFKNDPSHFFFEIYGRHAVANPGGKDGLTSYAYRNRIGGGYLWECIELGATTPACAVLPIQLGFERADFSDIQTLLVYQTCEPNWFCIEEKYQDWASFFYMTDAIPADYSAVPK